MPEPFLDVRNVRKNFGKFEALRGVSFGVQPGELFGLLGPNGAGKTTLLSIVACLSEPSSGEVVLDGKTLDRRDLSQRRIIGIGTQDLAIYPELTARENLAFFGRLYGLRGGDLKQRIDEVLELTGLHERADDRAGTFSGGMKRRLNLGVAVIHRPKLLLLDEPTTGVDPQSRNHIFERVRELNAAGLTVIYTSHYMEEVEALCPRLAILDNGRLIACDRLESLLQMVEGAIRFRVGSTPPGFREKLSSIPETRVVSADDGAFTLAARDVDAAVVAVVNLLRTSDANLLDLHSTKPNLEQVFLHLTEKALRD